MKSENTLTLRGTIVHLFYTDKVAIVTLKTITEAPNTPKVLYFGDLVEEVVANYGVGDLVELKGNIQSSRRKPNVAHQNMTSIFGESIKKIETIPTRMGSNVFQLAGILTDVYVKNENLVKIKVLTFKNGRFSLVNCDYYTTIPKTILAKFQKGCEVNVTGTVQTVKKVKTNGTKYFENYVVRNLDMNTFCEVV